MRFIGKRLIEIRGVAVVVVMTGLAQSAWNYLGHWGGWSFVVIALGLTFFVGTFFVPRHEKEIAMPQGDKGKKAKAKRGPATSGDSSPAIHVENPTGPVTFGPNSPAIQHNYGPAQRTLAGIDVTETRQFLASFAGTPVELDCPLGDGEAASFAEELKALLKSAGWVVNGVSHSVRVPPPPQGIGLGFIGADPSAHPWVVGLGNRLIAMGFLAYGGMNSAKTEVFVGRL